MSSWRLCLIPQPLDEAKAPVDNTVKGKDLQQFRALSSVTNVQKSVQAFQGWVLNGRKFVHCIPFLAHSALFRQHFLHKSEVRWTSWPWHIWEFRKIRKRLSYSALKNEKCVWFSWSEFLQCTCILFLPFELVLFDYLVNIILVQTKSKHFLFVVLWVSKS